MKRYIGVGTLLGVAVIFGMAFSFQSIASSYLSPFSLNGLRFLMAGIVLSPIFLIKDNTDTRTLIKAGILDGILLFGATNLQQAAIEVTSAGKAGFLTAMYIVLVPVFAFLFLKRKLHLHEIISVLLSLLGLYLLCGLSLSDLQLRVSDLFLIGCAMIFAIQILVVEHYVDKVHPIKMSTLAFLVAGILCIPFVLVKETITIDAFLKALPSLLYLLSFYLSGLYLSGCRSEACRCDTGSLTDVLRVGILRCRRLSSLTPGTQYQGAHRSCGHVYGCHTLSASHPL